MGGDFPMDAEMASAERTSTDAAGAEAASTPSPAGETAGSQTDAIDSPGAPQDPLIAFEGGSGEGTASPGHDVEGSAVSAEERASRLEQELSTLRADYDNLNGQYMRLAADFDNFRKRQSRDNDDLRVQIVCSTLSEILPVVDNFDRARQQLNPQHEEAQTLHRSYQGLYKQLVEVFKQLGVSPMRAEGEPFDPNLHEAVLREESHDHPEDMVIEELQRGYVLNGRVIRHALVKVSMGPGPVGAQPSAGLPEAEEQPG